jgi:DnaJ family protein C protein 2
MLVSLFPNTNLNNCLWIHFESWRDFTLRASTETEHDVDAADSRDEKRWMKQEIERKVKKMKKDEMARINLLVERAMAVDPRLRREKERIVREKKEKEDMKKRIELEKIVKENVEKELREREEASKRADEDMKKKESKKIKDAEKKQLRKARQLFRKLTMAAYQSKIPGGSETGNGSVWDDLETMNDDIELLCDKLSILELTSLTDLLGGVEAVEEESNVPVNVSALVDVQQCARETAAGAERQSLITIQRRNEARKADEEKARVDKAARATSPWSKDELGALAKGVKKYPPGGSNRWDAIALYVNNLCKLPDPRTKEECIEKYNSIAAAPPSIASSTLVATDVGETVESSSEGCSNVWNEEQDALLQEMLRKYPADMEKNERWKMIAKGVPGMTKKECVERYKAIRDAVQKKGKN